MNHAFRSMLHLWSMDKRILFEKDHLSKQASINGLCGGLKMGDHLSYQDKQMVYFASLIKKLSKNEPVHIVCQGDSMTYGHDDESHDIRPKKSDPTCETELEYPDHHQAGKTYPEALQEFCNRLYGQGKVTVTNRGFSGDWAEMSRSRWPKNPQADLHLIMLGTNDASNPYIPIDVQQNITKYVKDLGQLIEHILDEKSAIVLLTPPKHSNDNNLLITLYRQCMKIVGKKYHIPVIDATEFLKAYPLEEVQSDEVHYNTKGYTIFGAKVAGLIAGLSHIYEPYTIDRNQVIIPSMTEYGLTITGADDQTVTLEEHDDAPFGIGSSINKGLLFHLRANTSLTISFYAKRHQLVMTPLFAIKEVDGALQFTLDFGVEPGNFVLNKAQKERIKENTIKNKLTFKGTTERQMIGEEPSFHRLKNRFLLPSKGFYSMTIENTSLSDDVYLYGFIVNDAPSD